MKDADIRRRLAGWGAIAGPPAFALADILARRDILSNYEVLTYWALPVYQLADTLIMSTVLGLVYLLGKAPRGYGVAVSIAAFLGYMGGTDIWSEKYTQWSIQQTDPAVYAELIERMPSDVWWASFVPIHAPGLLFGLSLALLAIGFWRWTSIARWTAAFILAAAILLPLGRVAATLAIILPSPQWALASILAGDLCLTIAWLPFGWKILSGEIPWSGE